MKKTFIDPDLIHGALKKDAKAISQLIEASQKSLFTFCYFLTKNKQLAEDLTHDTFLRALTCLEQLKNPEAFLGWLKQIARSQYLDYVKSAAQSQPHISSDELEVENLSTLGLGSDPDQMTALAVLQKLSEEERSVLILADIQEYSYSEIAEIMKVREGTVKSRLFRARERFAEIFNGTNQPSESSLVLRSAK
jgi:RNA polymerase sigma-70 factor (ECF subfamily)